MAKARRPLAATTHAVQTAVRYGPRNTPAAALPHCRTIPAMPSAAPPACVVLLVDDDEVNLLLTAAALRDRGFSPFTLGPRVLRVDAAVPYAVGQAELWLRGGGRPG
jgi:hypothetical protein